MIRAVIWFMALYHTAFGAAFIFVPQMALGFYSAALQHFKSEADTAMTVNWMQLWGALMLANGLTHLLVALRGGKSSETLMTRFNAMVLLTSAFVLYFHVLPNAKITHTDERAIMLQIGVNAVLILLNLVAAYFPRRRASEPTQGGKRKNK
eukprot:EC724064.1.p1 GENE.EC724064.1~~EC724064.1.p1  ORF type:complete len:151 (+),score=16.37 EC724064.1:64-516(+)